MKIPNDTKVYKLDNGINNNQFYIEIDNIVYVKTVDVYKQIDEEWKRSLFNMADMIKTDLVLLGDYEEVFRN